MTRLSGFFLEVVMKRMRFNQKWIDVIMRCVSTVSYALIINGLPQKPFHPSRGIRQGDPLSPYIFILCVEALSYLIQNAETSRAIIGIPIARNQVHISHTFFVDDSLLFCKANPLEWSKLIQVLDIYELTSGQRLNKDKIFIFFSKNTKPEL